MAWVYDYNTGRYVYQSNWIPGNTWQELLRQSTFAPMINAAVYVRYARWTGSAWSYSTEWLVDFSQDDVYSHSCAF